TLAPKSRRGELTVSEVYAALLEIARTSGSGSNEKKIKRLSALIKSVSPLSSLYIARFAVGRLRLGVGAPTIIEAVARAQPHSREGRALIERAYSLSRPRPGAQDNARTRPRGAQEVQAACRQPRADDAGRAVAKRGGHRRAARTLRGGSEARRHPLPGPPQRPEGRGLLAQPRTHD